MGELNRARDAVHEATTMEARDAALDQYARVVRDYLLCDIESEIDIIEGSVDTEAAVIMVAWVRDILSRVRREVT